MKSVYVLGTRIERITGGLLVEEIAGYLRAERRRSVAKINAEFLVRALVDRDFRAYLNSTDLNVADGVGVVWAARFLTLRTIKSPALAHVQVITQALYSLSGFAPSRCAAPHPQRLRSRRSF
jgi:UDP-N-acetyl-D-mannosaminuronic acid transferase (WecB/TagA/CpsF family)